MASSFHRTIVVGGAMVLAGCQFIPGSEAQQIEQAKTVVKEQLVDGASAQFENVTTQKTMMVGDAIRPVDVPAVCGWVNAKNRMGGFAGADRFVVKDGVRTFGDASSPEWSDAFSMCIIHSNNTAASDRLTREGSRALDAYEDAVNELNETR